MPGIFNDPDLKNLGAQALGSPTLATPITAITVTGTLQDRPTGIRSQPQLFKANVTCAAAVTLTCGPGTTTRWKAGDQIRFYSTSALANAFAVQDATGPTAIGRITTAPTYSTLTIEFDGAHWSYVNGGN